MRIGTGYDVHKLAKGRKMIIGGVEIPYEKGLLGHSDADVLVHAVMDALLGAAGLDDIGKHFPDTDPQYKGISSMILLQHTYDMMKQNGYTIGNIDSLILCEEPKMAPHIPLMKENVARVLHCDITQVNIKATRGEKMGFVGRKEGIVAQSVVLLNKEG